jgi:hypothetical protein
VSTNPQVRSDPSEIVHSTLCVGFQGMSKCQDSWTWEVNDVTAKKNGFLERHFPVNAAIEQRIRELAK